MCIFQVHLISTNAYPAGEGDTLRRNRGGERVEVSRPPPVENYHHFMGGVDRNNQLSAKTPVGRPAKKWWKYIFFFVINLCITNAFIVYKESSVRPREKKYTLLDFRVDVAKELIGQFSRRKRHSCVPQPDQSHRLVRIVGAKRRCRWCSKQQIRRETVYGFNSCNIHLCKNDCFVIITVIIRCHLRIKTCICIIIGHVSCNFIGKVKVAHFIKINS